MLCDSMKHRYLSEGYLKLKMKSIWPIKWINLPPYHARITWYNPLLDVKSKTSLSQKEKQTNSPYWVISWSWPVNYSLDKVNLINLATLSLLGIYLSMVPVFLGTCFRYFLPCTFMALFFYFSLPLNLL